MAFKISIWLLLIIHNIKGDILNKKNQKPKINEANIIYDNEYFYRDNEMARSIINLDVFSENNSVVNNPNIKKHND